MNPVLIIGLFLLGIYYYNVYRASDRLTFRFGLPNSIRIDTAAVKFNLPVTFLNPSPTSINLNAIDFQTFIGGYYVGNSFFTQRKVIVPGESTIQITVVIPLDSILILIPELLRTTKEIKFTFRGIIRAEGFTIPLQREVIVPIPKIFK